MTKPKSKHSRVSNTVRQKKLHRAMMIAALAIAAASTASGQEPQTDQVPPRATGNAVRWSLGLGVISAPRPYVGARNSVRVVPLLELYYKRLFVQGIRLGVRAYQSGPVSLDVVAGPRFLGYEESDSSFLSGMAERKEAFDGGLSLGWNRRKYGVRAWARHDLSGHSDGAVAGVDAFFRRAYYRGKLQLQPGIGLEWLDGKTVDYYFGVAPGEARPGRPRYSGSAALNVSGDLLTVYQFTPRINLVVLLRLSLLGQEITDSPLVDRDLSYFTLTGLTYRF